MANKQRKRCLTSLVIRKTNIKTTLRALYTILAKIKNLTYPKLVKIWNKIGQEWELSYINGGSIN